MNPPILFIHGMFLNPKSWSEWERWFSARGYDCGSPAWPLHEGEPAELRRHVPEGLGRLTLAEVYQHHERIVREQTEPPVLIGHSAGGLLVQKLVAAGLARAGVAIASAAPNHMLAPDWSFLKNSALIANPLAGDSPFEMTSDIFHKTFANTLPLAASDSAHEAFAVHESRRILRDVMGDDGVIDTDRPHVPLLFLAGEEDQIIPPTLVMRNAHAYSDKRSICEYFGFSGRGHFLCGEPRWQEIAETIANWLEAHLAATRT
jgi:pimeloyl-ACP methyl ester carboxylesterase